MGKFQEWLETGDHHFTTKTRIEIQIDQFLQEYNSKQVWERDAVVRKWFGNQSLTSKAKTEVS